jgi:hypothetical protein
MTSRPWVLSSGSRHDRPPLRQRPRRFHQPSLNSRAGPPCSDKIFHQFRLTSRRPLGQGLPSGSRVSSSGSMFAFPSAAPSSSLPLRPPSIPAHIRLAWTKFAPKFGSRPPVSGPVLRFHLRLRLRGILPPLRQDLPSIPVHDFRVSEREGHFLPWKGRGFQVGGEGKSESGKARRSRKANRKVGFPGSADLPV